MIGKIQMKLLSQVGQVLLFVPECERAALTEDVSGWESCDDLPDKSACSCSDTCTA